MDYISGETIRSRRESACMTQKQLADRLCVSDKTISKWETGRGLPDICIIPELAGALGISVAELFTGEVAQNRNRCGNMLRAKTYVCPVCGNVLHALGEGAFSCCGVTLPALTAEPEDEAHRLDTEYVEDEIFVSMEHPMTREHYISFVTYLTADRTQTVKLYPEQSIELRFKRCGPGRIQFYCSRDGLFELPFTNRPEKSRDKCRK